MPGPVKLPASMRAATGRHDGVDSGGRVIATGPDVGFETPTRPSWLSPYAVEMWDRVTEQLEGHDVVRRVDEVALTALCETYSRWREAVDMRRHEGILSLNSQGAKIRAPWTVIESDSAKQLQSLLREFGLTPSSMGDIGAGASHEDDDDPFNIGYTA